MKHTRGPWRMMPNGIRWAVVADALERGDVCRAQHEADARLIAAAPDLLAACEAVAGVYDGADEMGIPNFARKCIAAAAKAKVAR